MVYIASAGPVTNFHALLVYNSPANASGRPRRIMIYSHYSGRADMGHDARNGPTRAHERPYEARYLEKVERGEFVPSFRSSPR